MPHALFLGSYLSTQDRISLAPPPEPVLPSAVGRPTILSRARERFASLFRITRADRDESSKDYRTRHGARENNQLSFIRAHLGHGIVDVITSLLALAVPINSASVIYVC